MSTKAGGSIDILSSGNYNKFMEHYIASNKTAGVGKGTAMDDDMNTAELLIQVAEENQTRKILEILNESESLEEAKEKVKALLNK